MRLDLSSLHFPSPFICMPVLFALAKEDDQLIQCEEKNLRQQIPNLPNIPIVVGQQIQNLPNIPIVVGQQQFRLQVHILSAYSANAPK
jgi:hypothetical protein